MSQQIKDFPLNPLLQENSRLTLNYDQGILSLTIGEKIIEQQLLSPSEMYVVEALLKNYPEYCPYEVVLSAMTGKSIEQCREKVIWGLDEGAVDVVMRPVRNLLGRCRLKLRPFGIEIKSIVHMGYLLVPLKRKAGARVPVAV
jgi:hypothetical protein